jgi:hypothetical protein
LFDNSIVYSHIHTLYLSLGSICIVEQFIFLPLVQTNAGVAPNAVLHKFDRIHSSFHVTVSTLSQEMFQFSQGLDQFSFILETFSNFRLRVTWWAISTQFFPAIHSLCSQQHNIAQKMNSNNLHECTPFQPLTHSAI